MSDARRRGIKPAAAHSTADNLRGSLWMIAAMAAFSLEDLALKGAASEGLNIGVILALFGFGGALGFALLAYLSGHRILHPDMASRAILLRAGAEVSGRMFYLLALAYGALSTTSAILQAAPLVVVAGAALFFGERVGWRRWLAIGVGFCGVLLILRPGAAMSGNTVSGEALWASLFAVLGMLGFSLRDLATRGAPKTLSTWHLGVCGFTVLVPTGIGLAWVQGGTLMSGSPLGVFYVLVGTLIGVGAYSALTLAMRTGEIGVVTPFRYSRLLFGVGLGILVFGERPDAMTILGSLIVLGAGLYTMLRETRARRKRSVTPDL